MLHRHLKPCMLYHHTVKYDKEHHTTTKGPVMEGDVMVLIDQTVTTRVVGTRTTIFNVPPRVVVYFFLFHAVPELNWLIFKNRRLNSGELVPIYRDQCQSSGRYEVDTTSSVSDIIEEYQSYSSERDQWLKKHRVLVDKARQLITSTRDGGWMKTSKLFKKLTVYWLSLTPDQRSGKAPVPAELEVTAAAVTATAPSLPALEDQPLQIDGDIADVLHAKTAAPPTPVCAGAAPVIDLPTPSTSSMNPNTSEWVEAARYQAQSRPMRTVSHQELSPRSNHGKEGAANQSSQRQGKGGGKRS